MKDEITIPLVLNQFGKKTILHELDADDLKAMFTELVNQCNVLSDLPDFEISVQQAQTILGVSFPTVKNYMDEKLLVNVSIDKRRAKFSFYQVVELRRNNPRYKRFRNVNI